MTTTSPHYATRNHAFAPATTLVIAGCALRIEEDQRPVRELPLATLRELRLEFTPSRPEPNRYRCRLTFNHEVTVEFYNRTYAAIYDFRDTSADYVAFVQSLIAAAQEHAPGCRLVAGTSTVSFWLNFALLAGMSVTVVIALIFFLSAGLMWVIVIKVLLVLFYTPVAIKWFRSNKPRSFEPGAVPSGVLPEPRRAGP